MPINTQNFVHCIELMTNKNLPGIFSISDKNIEAKIYSYDGLFKIDSKNPIFLRTEENYIVSLYDTIGGLPSRSTRILPFPMTCFHLNLIANIAIIGPNAWDEKDKIKRVTFSIKHSDKILRNRKKFDAISSTSFPSKESFLLYEDQTNGLSLSARYITNNNFYNFAPTSISTLFSIEYEIPPHIHDYLGPVIDYNRFFCFCLGAPLAPSDLHINRSSLDEIFEAVEARNYAGNHRVHYIQPEAEIDTNDLQASGSPVIAWDDAELSAFRACLIKWMERSPRWRKAYALMEACLRRRREFTPERLVNAYRWFEEIPLTSQKQAISDEDIDAIAKAAAQTAAIRGLPPIIEHRITGAIQRIKAETTEEHFRRLIKMVQGKFGSEHLPDTSIDHLKKARNFRGKTAHGHYSPKNKTDSRDFVSSILALEALCLLLMAYDLPISNDGIERMRSKHPLILNYRMFCDTL